MFEGGMMMGPMGPMEGPDEAFLETRPEWMTRPAAFQVWMRGYMEGLKGLVHRIFEMEPDMQPFYTDGHKRGSADRRVAVALDGEGAVADDAGEGGEEEAVVREPEGVEKIAHFLVRYGQPITSAYFAAGAVYMVVGTLAGLATLAGVRGTHTTRIGR